jgi:hypothetical protein
VVVGCRACVTGSRPWVASFAFGPTTSASICGYCCGATAARRTASRTSGGTRNFSDIGNVKPPLRSVHRCGGAAIARWRIRVTVGTGALKQRQDAVSPLPGDEQKAFAMHSREPIESGRGAAASGQESCSRLFYARHSVVAGPHSSSRHAQAFRGCGFGRTYKTRL